MWKLNEPVPKVQNFLFRTVVTEVSFVSGICTILIASNVLKGIGIETYENHIQVPLVPWGL